MRADTALYRGRRSQLAWWRRASGPLDVRQQIVDGYGCRIADGPQLVEERMAERVGFEPAHLMPVEDSRAASGQTEMHTGARADPRGVPATTQPAECRAPAPQRAAAMPLTGSGAHESAPGFRLSARSHVVVAGRDRTETGRPPPGVRQLALRVPLILFFFVDDAHDVVVAALKGDRM